MPKVAVVTDSTSYIPSEILQNLPVFPIPLYLIWRGKTYRDNVDISPEEFYTRLKTEKQMPQTAQVSPEVYRETFKNLLDQGYDVLGIFISSTYSGAYNTACQVARQVDAKRVEIFDSLNGGMATGFQILSAARASVQGATLRECYQVAERARQNSNIFFVPATLEFLRRGGRIGNTAAIFGSLLQISPILQSLNGVVTVAGRVRTFHRAVARLIDIVEQQIGDHSPVHLALCHSNMLEELTPVRKTLFERMGADRFCEIVTTGISPVLGTHIGPGGVGIGYMLEV